MKVIVLDTSVFISALLGPSGANREVLRACLKRQVYPLMGTALFLEYESVMARESLFSHCRLRRNERESLLDAFLSVCRWTPIYYTWRPNLKDEADNHLIELALAGGAQAIVTCNIKDFKDTELHFSALRILKPEAFLKEMN